MASPLVEKTPSRLLGTRPHNRRMEKIVIRKKKEPAPQYQFESTEHEYLFFILGELQAQGRTIKSMNTAVQIIGLIMILGVIGSCVWMLFGSAVF